MEILILKEIIKKFKGRKILNGLSLKIKEGEIFGIIGRSGCGKTTLLKVLIGMLNYDSGEIIFKGKKIEFYNKYLLKENIGFASQENMLYDELTLYENIKYFGKLYGLNKKVLNENFIRLIKLFELENFKDLLIKAFSGGMKKRANILVSLIHDPKVLVLDEPTIGLDPLLRERIWHYIKEINKLGKTIIVTSHLLEELQENCTTLAFMKEGKAHKVIDATKTKFDKKSLNEIFKEWIKNG